MVNWKSILSGPLGTKRVGSCTCYNLCGWFLGGSHFWGGRRSRRCQRAQGWNRHRTYVGVEDTNIDKHKLKYTHRTYLDRCGKIRVQIQNTDTSTNTDIAPCCWKCDYDYIYYQRYTHHIFVEKLWAVPAFCTCGRRPPTTPGLRQIFSCNLWSSSCAPRQCVTAA